jgi:hypothetical protein
MAFLQQLRYKILANQQPQTIVIESRADKCRNSKAIIKNNMLQLLLIGSDTDLSPPGTFAATCIPVYTQAMKNMLAQPMSIESTQMVNILSIIFKEVPDDIAKRLSPLTTHTFNAPYLQEHCTYFFEMQLSANKS